MIRHHRRWLLSVALIVGATALTAFWLMPRRYTAQADLWLDHGFERLAMAPSAAASNSALARNTEVRLLTSPDLARGVVDRLGLANVRGVGQPPDGPLLPVVSARRRATEAIVDNLRVSTSASSYAVDVRYTAADPVLATGILNNLVDSYVAERRSGGARGREQASMRAQVEHAREEAIRNQAAVTGFREAIDLSNSKQDRAAIQDEITSLDGAIKAATAEQAAADARLRQAQGGPGNSGITSPRIRDLRARQTEMTADRGAVSEFERGANAARANDLGRDLAVEVARVTRIADAANAARTRVELLRNARTRASRELKLAETAAARLRGIDAEGKTAQARYNDYAQRYQALISARRSDPGTAYVISRGSAGTIRRSPDPVLFTLGALIAALVAAAATLLLREALTKGFRTRQHLEKTLGKPVIGLVPDLTRVRDADFPADDPMGPPDYLYNYRHSAFSAAFRGIHAGLRLGVSGKSLRSIAICSALQGEGKTTVALCLARSAALAGLRVVLVDCDSRRPAASRALLPYVKTGLAHVLEDGFQFRPVLQVDTPSGASFLAQASDRPVSAGLAGSPRMGELIKKLEAEFDLVVLDTAPVLALAESRELAAMAGGVLLVARARKTPVGAAQMAQKMLEEARANVVAAVLTLVDP